MRRQLTLLCTLFLLAVITPDSAWSHPTTLPESGSLGFWFHVEDEYHNGLKPQGAPLKLLEAPNIFRITLGANASAVTLKWEWQQQGVDRLALGLPHLPGPAWYYLAYRWDQRRGLFTGFLNGVPLRIPDTHVPAWEMQTQDIAWQVGNHVEELEVSQEFWSDDIVRKRAEKRPHVDMKSLIGPAAKTLVDGTDSSKGALLYAPDFSKRETLDDWHMEGSGIYQSRRDGWLTMESAEPDASSGGHIVFWAPPNVPDAFVAEWDFQPLSNEGLCIVFFAATGRNGEHLFDPSLTKRIGNFGQYIKGDIACYHISYYANTPFNPGRIVSNLRKNPGFFLVSNGQPSVPAGSKDIHKVTLVKQKGHIRFAVDGIQTINWTDEGTTYGPIYGKGMIGFRQMRWMKARYRNLKVWDLSK